VDLALSGRRAVVTGGSKGLGRAIARDLVAEGVDVAICARGADELTEAAEELRRSGRVVHAQVADVTREEDIRDFVAAAAQALGGIDILVNNAGAARPGTFESLTDDDLKSDLDVKLFSQIRCTREALPHLRRSDAARVININAVQAKMPDPAFFATTLNRAACLNFSKVLAIDLAKDDILVNSVNIGYVATPQWAAIHARRAPELGADEFFSQLAEKEVPLGRFGRDDEVSGIVAFLASGRSSYITGASIDVAGGMGRYV
jgi:3-oxoacyl-[acyl-carrier protein] reductase